MVIVPGTMMRLPDSYVYAYMSMPKGYGLPPCDDEVHGSQAVYG